MAKAILRSTSTPAVPIRKCVTGERVICLDCGKSFASIKRHLRTAHDLTPDAYRARWGLAKDYSIVAASYSASRSALAKAAGLGQGGRGGVGRRFSLVLDELEAASQPILLEHHIGFSVPLVRYR